MTSTRGRKLSGTLRPIAFSVSRLIDSSDFLGGSIGMSFGSGRPPPVGFGPKADIVSPTCRAILNRRTGQVAIRAEHATVARLRLEPRTATRAVVEKLTRIRWHRLGFDDAAVRASNAGLQMHFLHTVSGCIQVHLIPYDGTRTSYSIK